MQHLPERRPTQRRGLTAIDGALALIAILLVVQMWLLTATLESLLAGHREGVLPAAVVSGILLAACFGLYLFIRGVDREVRKG
ncbi:MAG TPA: DUF6755 family protein [Thermoanaerobaculia bacterium]|nr:DUF6755 family protein [Thermoanaerobaculia bacterium]